MSTNVTATMDVTASMSVTSSMVALGAFALAGFAFLAFVVYFFLNRRYYRDLQTCAFNGNIELPQEGEEGGSNNDDDEDGEGLYWKDGKLVTKVCANANLSNLPFRPKKPMLCAGQEVAIIIFQHFLHVAGASMLLLNGIKYEGAHGYGSTQAVIIVFGLLQFVAVILTVFWQITRGVAYQDGYSPNLFGTCQGLDKHPSRPFLTEAWARGRKAFGPCGKKGFQKFKRAVRKVARRGGIYNQEWLAYQTPMTKLEGTFATLATCIGYCHVPPVAWNDYGACQEGTAVGLCRLATAGYVIISALRIVFPLGCLGFSALSLANLSQFSNLADRTGDTYQWSKVEVFKHERHKQGWKWFWKYYMIAYNASMLSGFSVACFYLGPLITIVFFCPVIVAYFYTHGTSDFRELGWRLYIEYLCVPACFLMPGGDRGHSPFGLIMRPISPKMIYLAQCWFLLSTGVLSVYQHSNHTSNFFSAYNATQDFGSFALVSDLLKGDLRALAAAPLVEYLFPVWILSSSVTVSGVIALLCTKRAYMSGVEAVDMAYRSEQMEAADSLEGWADAQDSIWEKQRTEQEVADDEAEANARAEEEVARKKRKRAAETAAAGTEAVSVAVGVPATELAV